MKEFGAFNKTYFLITEPSHPIFDFKKTVLVCVVLTLKYPSIC